MPAAVRLRRGLLGRRDAVELIHRPRLEDDVRPGMRRLRYDEAFVLQTILGQRRRAAQALHTSARMPRANGLLAAFDARLPFTLTAGQREVGDLISDGFEMREAAKRAKHDSARLDRPRSPCSPEASRRRRVGPRSTMR